MSSDERFTAKIEDFRIKTGTKEKVLGVNLYSNISFKNHVTCPYKRSSQKLYALVRISQSIAPLYECFTAVT